MSQSKLEFYHLVFEKMLEKIIGAACSLGELLPNIFSVLIEGISLANCPEVNWE